MNRPLLGVLLAIAGAALVFFAERFAGYESVAMFGGLAIILIGISQVTALQDYWHRLEAASKRKPDESDDSSGTS